MSLEVNRNSNNADGARFVLQKTRNTSSSGGNTAVISGDTIGSILFRAGDGVNKLEPCKIETIIDTVVSAGTTPVRLDFFCWFK